MTQDDIQQIISALRTHIPVEVDMWGPDEIASYLKVSRRTVAERYAARPDFPKCHRLPTEKDGGRGMLRWKASEIIEWAEKH
ncbi:MAG: helix-turn-helix domain-containing protein [Candidatus Thiodiazotropha endolucinida]